ALAVQREKTEEALLQFHTAAYARQLAEAQERWRIFDVLGAELTLAGCRLELRGWEWGHLHHMCNTRPLTIKGHADDLVAVAYGRDGTRIASGSLAGTVRVWDARTGRDAHTLRGHAHRVLGVAFSPDGTRIASASWDQTVKVWDSHTGPD